MSTNLKPEVFSVMPQKGANHWSPRECHQLHEDLDQLDAKGWLTLSWLHLMHLTELAKKELATLKHI